MSVPVEMDYSRRGSREPEAQSLGEPPRASLRARVDPPTTTSDSSGPSISLSDRQLELLAMRRQKQQTASLAHRDNAAVLTSRSNKLHHTEDTPTLPMNFEREHSSPPPPIRTRNPVSRDSSGSYSGSPAYWQQILLKAKSTSSTPISNTTSSSAVDDKQSIKKALAQRMMRNKQSRGDKVVSMKTTSSFRDRVRRSRKDDYPSDAVPTVTSNLTVDTTESPSNKYRYSFYQPDHQSGVSSNEDDRFTALTGVVSSNSRSQVEGFDIMVNGTKALSKQLNAKMNASFDDGYDDFFQKLQTEVAGQHSQVSTERKLEFTAFILSKI